MRYFGLRALIVEHGAIGRILLEKILRQLGFSVQTASGAEDLRRPGVAGACFDLAVVDADLPDEQQEVIFRFLAPEGGQRAHILLTVSRAHPSPRGNGPRPDGVALKPIGKASLERLIDELFNPGQGSSPNAPGSPSSPGGMDAPARLPGIDAADAMFRLGGSFEVLRNLLQIFSQEHRGLMPVLRRLAQEKDRAGLQARAHAVKGAAANISAHALSQASLHLEKAAAAKDDGQIPGALDALEESLQTVLRSIETLR